jgi:hypothetical protein
MKIWIGWIEMAGRREYDEGNIVYDRNQAYNRAMENVTEYMAIGEHVDSDAIGVGMNPNGPYNKALMTRMTELSVADNWDEAKKEWRITGEVWYIPLSNHYGHERLPQVHQDKHPRECLCGHRIAWHFEVENTENGELEVLGSEHVTNWMIIRHLIEECGIPLDAITEDKIAEWVKAAVKSMKHDWWWNEWGEEFEELFNEVKELDLRVNVRKKGRYWDHKTRGYEDKWVIAKTKKGSLGRMASVVWRWNHPDNPKAQINTRGYPNERLWRDIQLLYAMYEEKKEVIDAIEADYEQRAEEGQKANAERVRRQEIQRIASEERNAQMRVQDDEAITKACEFYDLPFVSADAGKNDWERKFIRDMRSRLINSQELSERQIQRLLMILEPDAGHVSLATYKQIGYIKKLGGEVQEGLTKQQASDMIGELLEAKRNG